MDNLTVSKEKVKEAAAKCTQAKEILKILFPEIFEPKSYEEIIANLLSGHCEKVEVFFPSTNELLKGQFIILCQLMYVAMWFNQRTDKTGKFFHSIERNETDVGEEFFIKIKEHKSIRHPLIYFSSKEDAEEAIKIIGEENLIKALWITFK